MMYYFTYGSDGQPYYGGWTEIVAPDAKTAQNLFKALHPHPDNPEMLWCCTMYPEDEFVKTSMYEKGNFGVRCNERVAYVVLERPLPVCPICKKPYSEYPALSRKDNVTKICPSCGTDEALEEMAKMRRKEN